MAIDTRTAQGIITSFLREYGLTFTTTQINNWVGMLSDSGQGVMPLIEEQIRDTTQFKRRFPGLEQRLANGYNQISLNEYLALENAYASTLRAAGLPSSFYDSPSDFARFIANDVSVSEFETRVMRGVVAAQQAPPEIRDALRDFYGIQNTVGALAAYYLDPDRALPVIERQFQTAMVAGTGRRFGFDLDESLSGRLVETGIQSQEQAAQGFSQASQLEHLSYDTITENVELSVRELLLGTFGTDADSQRKLRDRIASRRAQLSGSMGGPVGTSSGLGIGGVR